MLYATMRIGNNCEYFLFQSIFVNAYQQNRELDGFSRIVSNDEIREKKFNLNISLYAYQSVLQDALTVSKEDAINVWISSHSQCINEMDELIKLIK